jgi:hypothetical protein
MNDNNKQKNCTVCKKTFTPTRKGHINCSSVCNSRAAWLRKKGDDVIKDCPICNKPSVVVKNKRYCSSKCTIKASKKRQNNIKFKVIRRVRCRIKTALKVHVSNKLALNLLGCSLDEYCNYLESFFNDDMNWNNMSDWDIDHTKPICEFKLPFENSLAFNFLNTRPMLRDEHILKTTEWRISDYPLNRSE